MLDLTRTNFLFCIYFYITSKEILEYECILGKYREISHGNDMLQLMKTLFLFIWAYSIIGEFQKMFYCEREINFVGFFFLSFVFSGPHLWHIEVPRLGSTRSYSCWLTPQLQQLEIQAMSVTYTTAHGNARSLTHWVRAGIKPASSWMLVEFVNHRATTGTPNFVGFFWWGVLEVGLEVGL